MPYPLSPFGDGFNARTLLENAHGPPAPVQNANFGYVDRCVGSTVATKLAGQSAPLSRIQIQTEAYLSDLLKWLCSAPAITTFRVNTLTHNTEQVRALILKETAGFTNASQKPSVDVSGHPLFPEVIVLHNWSTDRLNLEHYEQEVIVDVACAAAVLRGAHVFAPGIIGMLKSARINDSVSIYADLTGQCKKGLQKKYECSKKLFLGNGIIKMNRYHLFGPSSTSIKGTAVEVTDTVSGCPCLIGDFLPKGGLILQNLPSILCCHVLNPQANEIILDMCAAPGNKTTHIAALTDNQSTLIAIDKTPSKVDRLKIRCDQFGARVLVFQADSRKIVGTSGVGGDVTAGPPFTTEVFDRILLDAPCSALGKRPQLVNNITERILRSYIPLQKRLFQSAVRALKVGGRLVYSTCTITLAENEGMVAWALKKFDCMELVKAEPHLGGPGLPGGPLDDAQRICVQRFGPEGPLDSIGFFLAVFVKRNKCPWN